MTDATKKDEGELDPQTDNQEDIEEKLKIISVKASIRFENDSRFRALKVRPKSKEPLERGWTSTNNYAFNSKEIDKWIIQNGNYGIFCPDGSCCFVDADTLEIQKILDEKLPSLWYSTGRKGHRQYVYAIIDPPISNIPLKEGAYIKGKNGYALGPGSVHPNGRIYGLERGSRPIREVTKTELLEVLKPFLIRQREPKKESPVISRKSVNWLSLADLLDLSKFRQSSSQYQGPHPIHGSETGVNLSIDISKNVWHCFRHDSGGSVLEWIAVSEGIIDCSGAIPGALRGDKFWQVIEVANRKYGLGPETVARMLKGEAKT
jgi:hypothetical protein